MKVGVGNDKTLLDKMWFIFEDKAKKSADLLELLAGIEVFRSPTTRSLLSNLLDIVNVEGNGFITDRVAIHVFQALCFKPEEKTRIGMLSTLSANFSQGHLIDLASRQCWKVPSSPVRSVGRNFYSADDHPPRDIFFDKTCRQDD